MSAVREKLLAAKDSSTVRLIGFCDPHLSAINPSAWKVDYREVLQNTIRQVFRFGQSINVDAYLWAGDIFHRKSPAQNPLWFIKWAMDLLEEGGAPHLGIAGNHDLKFGSLKGLPGQPLELLAKAGFYHLLDDHVVRIQADSFDVQVAGLSYRHGEISGIESLEKRATWMVILLHCWFGPATGEFFGERMWGPEVLAKFAPDVFMIGHHHADQGVLEYEGKFFCSQGSITRVGAHAQDLQRRPAAVLLEFCKDQIIVPQIIRPRVPDAADCLDLEVRERIVEEKKQMNEFVQALNGVEFKAADPKEILAQETDIAAPVRERVEKYLSAAEDGDA